MIRRAVAFALVTAALSSSWAVRAQDTYRAEAGLMYAKTSSDTERQRVAGLDATYYFDKLPAQPKDTPYEQVAFVERVGGLSASYSWISFDVDNTERLSNGYSYGAAVQFAMPETFLRASAAFEYVNLGKSRQSGVETTDDLKAYRASIGAYVGKTTSVDLLWSRDKTTTTLSNAGAFDVTVDGVGLSAMHLAWLPGGGHVAITASARQLTLTSEGLPTEKNREILLQATYYPTTTLGLTLGISSDRGDEDSLEGETYIVSVRSFFTPAFSLSLDYRKFNAKMAGHDADAIILRGALRF